MPNTKISFCIKNLEKISSAEGAKRLGLNPIGKPKVLRCKDEEYPDSKKNDYGLDKISDEVPKEAKAYVLGKPKRLESQDCIGTKQMYTGTIFVPIQFYK